MANIVYHYAKLPPIAHTPKVSTVYEEFVEVDEVEVVDKEKEIYNVKKVSKVKKSYDTQKLANSFKSFGIESIIRKFAVTGDESLLGTITGESFTDLTSMPDSIHDLKKVVEKGEMAKSKLENLTGKKIDSITQTDLDKAIAEAVDKILISKGLKKEEVVNE